MQSTPYVIGAIIVSMIAASSFGAGTSDAQTEALQEEAAEARPVATPARYSLGEHAGFDEATQALAAQGFDVVAYDAGDRRIEITGLTATGHCLELKFHPVSGKELRRKRDDDCRAGGGGGFED